MLNPTVDGVVVFGASGRLGREIVAELHSCPHIADKRGLRTPPHNQLELYDHKGLEDYLLGWKPQLIINCAAMNGLEACEDDPALAFAVNAQAPIVMASAAKRIGAVFIHFSSDYAAVNEDRPWGVYGWSKLHGEVAVEINPFTTVFRLSSIYSVDDFGGSLDAVKQVRKGAGTRDNPVRVLKQYTNPTWVGDVAKIIVKSVLPEILNDPRKNSGVHSFCAVGPVWKSDFARQAVRAFEQKEITVVEGRLPLPRPESSVMNISSFITAFPGVELLPVSDSLANAVSHWEKTQKEA